MRPWFTRARHGGTLASVLALAVGLAAGPATAQQDRAAERNARRQQMQLLGLQQQLQQAQSDKSKAEAERAELQKKLQGSDEAVGRALAAQRGSSSKLKTAEADRDALAAKVAELEKTLEERRRGTEQALAGKDLELAQAAQRQQAQGEAQAALQARFAGQVRLVTECGNKNDRLFRLSAELIDRYRGKGVFDALRQQDPVLGLSDVQMFNEVQEYRDQALAERFTPAVETR
jgi:uncharacterized membrane-anchored protein YhcB (DUF1043 family)